MAALEARLEAVEARLAIEDLVARYARAVDSRDMDALMALYIPGVETRDGRSGLDALREQFQAILTSYYRTVHQIVGQIVELESPDRASGTVYCRAEHECGDRWVTMALCYFDDYERCNDHWRFKSRQVRRFYSTEATVDQVVGADSISDGLGRGRPLPQRWPSWQTFWDDVAPHEIAKLTRKP